MLKTEFLEFRIAVLIPCHNEGVTIANVVKSFREELPSATIYVYDNNSTDGTVLAAEEAGAIVQKENRQGKGFVIQSMFREIVADVYVMVDGDNTYSAKDVNKVIAPILDGQADMVIGSRLHETSESAFRKRNRWGNIVFRKVLNSLFRVNIEDLLSGYRAFNRRLVKGTPLFEGGFATETEMTIKALEQGFRVVEVPVDLASRPEGSFSKISHFKDGISILTTIVTLWRDYRPLRFFSYLALFIVVLGSIPGAWAIADFLNSGELKRVGAALMAVGLYIMGLILWVAALFLHSVNRRFREVLAKLQNMQDDK
nr:glycosyltransferase [Desulfobulbaceae bacterium]